MNSTLQISYRTLALEYVQTREQWLEHAAAMIRDSLIPQLAGHRCRVSCGWPHKAAVARTSRRVGECWYPEHSTDRQSHNLFISPALQDPIEVLETLAHELIHVAAGPNVGHKGAFVKIAKSMRVQVALDDHAGDAGPDSAFKRATREPRALSACGNRQARPKKAGHAAAQGHLRRLWIYDSDHAAVD